ncbi:glycoside hydrolase family 95-like protein [Amycolatopsis sp. cmx-8-4]|uniref:glycoside hydrolase family 95-like protein n=1 Tax=Amycolatopsis sp. cmx-8-4 TaxID=2790947 RepID=UPI0039789749
MGWSSWSLESTNYPGVNPVGSASWLTEKHVLQQADVLAAKFTARLAELVLQSHNDVVTLLPARPAEWANGEARGLRCRGGLAVDLEWREGELVYAVLRRLSGDPADVVRVRHRGRETELRLRAGESTVLKGL